MNRIETSRTTTFLIFAIIGIISFSIRLYLNFSNELLSGGGGYYPLQVRSILENGRLGFPDMPFIFYLDASIVKLISLFAAQITDSLILFVVKLVDTISIPLLLIPLYRIIKCEKSISNGLLFVSVIAFAVLSFAPINLVSGPQKNALAIAFFLSFIAALIGFCRDRKLTGFVFIILFLLLTGLTHFGAFCIALFFLILVLIQLNKRKAILPIIAIVAAGLLLIFAFDPVRFYRIVTVWRGIFEGSALVTGRIGIPNIGMLVLAYAFAIPGVVLYKRNKHSFQRYQQAIIVSCITMLFVFPLPFYEEQYIYRLSVFLFIPQTLLLIYFGNFLSKPKKLFVASTLGLITLFSTVIIVLHPRPLDVDDETYADLTKISAVIDDPEKTLIIARHGLEWWTAWALKTKVAQEKAMDAETYEKYETVIILNQIRRHSPQKDRSRKKLHGPFREPRVPDNAILIYDSEYFKAYKVEKNE